MTEGLRLMCVHAHPDDESSKGAATMARYVAEGVEVMVVTCTGGERGSILNPELKDRADIKAGAYVGVSGMPQPDCDRPCCNRGQLRPRAPMAAPQ